MLLWLTAMHDGGWGWGGSQAGTLLYGAFTEDFKTMGTSVFTLLGAHLSAVDFHHLYAPLGC